MQLRDVVIVSAVRTAIGSYGGTLANILAHQLGSVVIKGALEKAGVDPKLVDEVIMGNILQGGQGQNPARQAAINAGLDVTVPAMSINKVCGSGLKAVHLAYQAIAAGEADVIVAGGMENMSLAPYYLQGARFGFRMGDSKAEDAMLKDGLMDAFNDYHMGITAENIAEEYKITREAQDQFAAWSQQKTEKALAEGIFADEIVPVMVPQKKGDPLAFVIDEFPRSGITAESLAKLKPAFKKDGTVTAGNASGINDGAAALIIMSRDKAEELGLEILAVIKANASGGVDPSVMGLGPIPATRKALAKLGWTVNDLELIEANEAFAVQMLAVGQELGFPNEKVNVNGGAISLGHPIGASGARILVTLLHEMKRRDAKKGLATLCIGGGMGVATLVERD